MDIVTKIYRMRYCWRVWQNTEWVPDDERYDAYWTYLELKEAIDGRNS